MFASSNIALLPFLNIYFYGLKNKGFILASKNNKYIFIYTNLS